MALDAPNYTQFPNAILDKLPTMSNSEFRIVAVAARLTFGWHKTSEAISVSQFVKHSGLSRQGALNGIQEALSDGYLVEVGIGKRGVKIYRLEVVDQSTTLTSEGSDWSSTLTSETADQSTTLTSTSQRRVPTKEKKEKKNLKEKEILPPLVSDSAPVQEKLQLTQPVVAVDENPFSKNWQSALHQLEIQLDRGNFDTWLRGMTFQNCETPPPGSAAPPSPIYVIGGARNQIQVDMLQNRLYRTIRRIVSDVHGSAVELRFEITDPPKLPDFLNLPETPVSDDPAPEVLRAARQADVERLYEAYVHQPTAKDRNGLKVMAQEFPVADIEEAFKNVQFQHSRKRVDDPLGYAWGILRRGQSAKYKYQPLGF